MADSPVKGLKVSVWTDQQAKKEIKERFQYAVTSRKYMEDRWQRNEVAIFSHTGTGALPHLGSSIETFYQIGLPGIDNSDADINVSYAFKNLRFIHAQMSANPPSVVMRPNSSDPDDRRAADGADRVVRYAIRHYNMQERVDQASLQALTYGTGVAKLVWDSTRGEIVEYNEEENEVILEGDINVTIPHIWNIFIDPDAQCIDDIKWVIERIYIDFDEAVSRWPERRELLEKARIARDQEKSDDMTSSMIQNDRYNMVELLEYWETGLPSNGFLGRYALTTTSGDSLVPCRPSPNVFPVESSVNSLRRRKLQPDIYRDKREKLPRKAQLPYHFLTDVDVPNKVWGKSFLDYIAHLQNNLNRIDTSYIDYIQANGRAKILVPAGTEITEMDNTNWDVTKYEGAQPPHFMEVPQLPSEMALVRQYLLNGINDVSGINESMLGVQSREQSGASMQYASNQGNMIRRRLFNKYVLFVEKLYKNLLRLVANHWDVERIIHVIGKEKALEAVEIKGMDIDGGYDVIGEYGVSLSLDPMTRREEIITLQPLLKEAGIQPRTVLKFLKLNELEGMYDQLQLAEDRQMEYFEEMIGTGKYIAPEMFQDHENMIAYAMQYFMTVEFKYLDPELQALCHQHIVERAGMPAKEKMILAGNQTPPPGAVPPPEPMAPPVPEMPVAPAPEVPAEPIVPPPEGGI